MNAKSNLKPMWIIFGIINAFCIITLWLHAAITIPALNMWFYIWQFGVNDTYATVNMLPEHLHEVTYHMIRYMRGQEPYLQIMTIVGGQERYFFSDIEIRHMVDVYHLLAFRFPARNIALTLAILTLAAFAIWGRKHLKYLFKSWQIASLAALGALIALVVAIAINWHHAFEIFHLILFDNDYWILDPRVDLLINIVPYNFFITISIFIGGFFAAGLVAMCAISTILLRRVRSLS